MLLTEAQAKNIFHSSLKDTDFTIVEEGNWEDDGKFSVLSKIFSYKQKYYCLSVTRTGTYFTNYDFEYDLECPEVFKRTVLQTIWSTAPEGVTENE